MYSLQQIEINSKTWNIIVFTILFLLWTRTEFHLVQKANDAGFFVEVSREPRLSFFNMF